MSNEFDIKDSDRLDNDAKMKIFFGIMSIVVTILLVYLFTFSDMKKELAAKPTYVEYPVEIPITSAENQSFVASFTMGLTYANQIPIRSQHNVDMMNHAIRKAAQNLKFENLNSLNENYVAATLREHIVGRAISFESDWENKGSGLIFQGTPLINDVIVKRLIVDSLEINAWQKTKQAREQAEEALREAKRPRYVIGGIVF